jgi:hypothetical protein
MLTEQAAPHLLAGLKCRHVVADRDYDADALLELVRASGAKAHIPSTRSRRIQRSVNRRKHFRRIATRFGSLSAVALASSRLWLRTPQPSSAPVVDIAVRT